MSANLSLLALWMGDKDVDISAHADLSTHLILTAIALLIAFFAIRPELWRRMLFQRVDPRPVALMRIGFGLVVLVTFLDLLKPHGPLEDSVARYLFTDEGLWLTDMARKNYGGPLKTLWDPEHGFENWYDIFKAMWGKFSILHFRSDPPFVFAVYGAMLTCITLMILGVWTRWTTLLAWILVEMVYRYSPVFYTGGDTVVRVFLFLGVFAQWGQAYSIDSWRRRRKAILGRATEIPPLRLIPAWPMRMMMLQLAIIYCATGLLKSGSTWANGTALYYALNLEHFYRFPQMGIVGAMHWLGVLPVMVIVVHWWEVLFPLAVIGACLNAYERERAAGTWPPAAQWRRMVGYVLFFSAWGIGAYIAGLGAHYYLPNEVLAMLRISRSTAVTLVRVVVMALPLVLVGWYLLARRMSRWQVERPQVEGESFGRWTRAYLGYGLRWVGAKHHRFVLHWVLGKRFWLVFGFGMHLGIDAGMNVGTFANVMMAVYLCWLSGDEVEAFWRYVVTRPLPPGEGGRPERKRLAKLLQPIDRLRYRIAPPTVVIVHHPGEASVRRAALLRLWDLSHRLEFQADPDATPEQLLVRLPKEQRTRSGIWAGHALIRLLPGLWWMRGLRHVPGLSAAFGLLTLKILRQR